MRPNPTRRRSVHTLSDITIARTYRVNCPQCGQVGDPAESEVDARNQRRAHWTLSHYNTAGDTP